MTVKQLKQSLEKFPDHLEVMMTTPQGWAFINGIYKSKPGTIHQAHEQEPIVVLSDEVIH